MCTDVSGQGDLSLFLGDELAPANGEEQATCLALSKSLNSHVWDGLRDHHQLSLSDSLSPIKMNNIYAMSQLFMFCHKYITQMR